MKCGCVVTLLLLAAWPAGAQEGLSDDILQLSGNKRVKIVWMQDTTNAGDNVFGGADVSKLYGYDTEDDTIRVIKGTLDDYTRPFITVDGSRIVYADKVENKVYVVNWDGSSRRLVANGFASTSWLDGSSGKEWVYYQEEYSKSAIKRVNLDDTSQVQLVWNQTEAHAHWLSVSADGTRIAGGWPWPECGAIVPRFDGSGDGDIYYPPNGYYETGCWLTITPDDRYIIGVFDGPHRAWKVWDWPPGQKRTLDLHSAPGINGWEIYHPRMSNHPRFLTITGPYSKGNMGDNNIGQGGTQVEIYLGKVDAGFAQVTDWVKITSNSRADFYPHAWVDSQVVAKVQIDSFTAAPAVIMDGGTSTLQWTTRNATSVSIDQGIGVVSASGSADVSPTQDTTYTLTAEGTGGPLSRQVTVSVVSVSLPLAINCGDQTPAVGGWQDEDPFRTGGNEYDFDGAVDLNGQPNAAPADVYLTCVHTDHSYSFPVPDGTYTVRLHFYDQHGSTLRAMDYTIEGIKVLDDFNIAAEAGGGEKALVKKFTVVVSDGDGIQITVDKDQGNDVFENGIEILEGGVVDTEEPTVTILAPQEGEVLSGDVVVQGTASDNMAVARVEVSLDGGAWELAEGTTDWSHTIFALALDDGAHTISARASDPSGNQGFDAVHITTDNAPSVTITNPSGGESWVAGSPQTIGWTTTNLDGVTIHYSVDGGETYTQIVQSVASHQAEWGNYPWVVPNEGTDSARILIHGYLDSTVRDESELFTIVPSGNPQIQLSSPTGGEVLTGNTTFTIQFEAIDVETAVVEYSQDAGSTFEEITTTRIGDSEWGQVPWTVPNVATAVAQVRVRTQGGSVQDSSGLFTIEPESTQAGPLEVTRLVLTGSVPGEMDTVQVAGETFEVQKDRTFEAQIELSAGASRITFQVQGSDGKSTHSRLVQLDVEDAEPPIPGLGVSKAELVGFLGGHQGILVWVDAGKRIRVLDFRRPDPQVELLSDDLECNNPLISPDGTRVVYSRGPASTYKTIFVRDLAGGDAQKIAVGEVGYWHFSGGEESIVYCDWSKMQNNGADGSTYRQKLVTGTITLDGDRVEIHDRAMDAGPNADLIWLGQVYENLWAHNLGTGTDYPTDKFFLMDQSVADHQSCNGSMAPDSSGRLMCLVIPHDFVRVFTFDAASDTFQQTSEFRLPPGMTEWEFPEWSTDAGYFTAVLRAEDLRNRLFLVKLVEGDLVPEVLEISGEETGASYGHLYIQ